MMLRLMLIAAALPLAASAQLQLFLFDGTAEKAVSTVVDYGNVAIGDSSELRFRARNNTNASIALQTVSLGGQGFSISSAPTLPYIVAPSNYAEIRVRFSATMVATYSATLAVNEAQTLLRATAIAAAAISTPAAGVLTAGGTVDFGRVLSGQSASQTLTLSNPSTASPITIQSCSISGSAFTAQGLQCPMNIAAGASARVTVTFNPTAAGVLGGTIAFDSRTFLLSGVAYDPPLPKPTVKFSAPLTSGTQQKLVISLETVSQTSGAGTVTMTFQPASSNMTDDPAIQFVKTGSRRLSFTVKNGDSSATFPAGVDTTFQTGTTAGTITFEVVLGSADLKFDFPIAGAAIAVDSATAVRRTGALDVSITGFDNTGTAGRFSFTFYDSTGATVQPGAISADWTTVFTSYFKQSKSGGSFTMRASFPVSGDASTITAVDIQMSNSTGPTQVSRLSF